jgi:acyl-CoA thioesterase-1
MSGETTAGGAARIARELDVHDPDLLVLELGANDALRGLPLADARANLQRIIDAAVDQDAEVLLLGMRMPPNYGKAYADAFVAMYHALGEHPDVSLLPFLLEPIAFDRDAFQADDVHPVAEVQPRLMEHVWPAIKPLLAGTPAP